VQTGLSLTGAGSSVGGGAVQASGT
jgi:hypothetical protein